MWMKKKAWKIQSTFTKETASAGRPSSEEQQPSTLSRIFNVNEEYTKALRTNSYAEFYSKAQQHHLKSSLSLADFLLEPRQETIIPVLENSAIFSNKSDLKHDFLNYFDISADASKICSSLLRSINQTQANHRIIQNIIQINGDFSPEQYRSIISEFDSFNQLVNPFVNYNPRGFQQLKDRYASNLNGLKAKRKGLLRRRNVLKSKKLAGICFFVTFSVAVVALSIVAAHAFSGVVVGPLVMCLSRFKKNRFMNHPGFKTGLLKRLGEQLDAIAKGTYILNRDFDTIGRLVTRLHDEIEHNRSMIRFCLERRENKFPMVEVVKELKKNDEGFREQMEELEEHVYLCLLMINRVRVLVIQGISSPSVGE